MKRVNKKNNVVLTISGHDPTGGAGIQADLQTLGTLNCIPVSVVTMLSTQNTFHLSNYVCQNDKDFSEQLSCLLNDVSISAIKVGAVGNIALAKIIVNYLKPIAYLPIVIDPVLSAGGGGSLSSKEYIEYITHELLPLATLITPNRVELEQLSHTKQQDSAAIDYLFSKGIKNILVTTAFHDNNKHSHHLYQNNQPKIEYFSSPHIDYEFHGSGCTLSSAITAYLTQGYTLYRSISLGIEYTYQTLHQALTIGHGQLIPNRISQSIKTKVQCPSKGLYAITDCSLSHQDEIISKTQTFLQCGVSMLQFRCKDKTFVEKLELALTLRSLCAYFNTPFIINDDLELAIKTQADGLHLGKNDLDLSDARKKLPNAIMGISCYNSIKRAIAAEQAGADYIAFGSFFPSATKPDATRVNLEILSQAKDKLTIPIIAIGGITPENGKKLLLAGADMLAVISGLYQSNQPKVSVSRYLELFTHHA